MKKYRTIVADPPWDLMTVLDVLVSDLKSRLTDWRARQPEREYERTRPPSNIERMLAAEVGRLLSVEIDPKRVRDLGYKHPYYLAEVDAVGLTFIGRYMSDTNGLHRIAAGLDVSRRRFGIRQTRSGVFRIGDLDGWL